MVTQCIVFFFFNDTATTEIYTLSLHDALPISSDTVGSHRIRIDHRRERRAAGASDPEYAGHGPPGSTMHRFCVFGSAVDRKSTRLNSSHSQISYAVFCLK